MRKFTLFILAFFFATSCSDAKDIDASSALDTAGRHNFRIDIPAGETDPATFIPMTTITGAKSGPTVLMVAGVHGYEFAPILAAQKLADDINSDDLSGTLMIVRIAHVSAFENRSPYVNPYDRLNLNRSFPGKKDGTQTERIAYALSTEIIPKADIVFDVHSGDGAEWLEAFVGVYGGPLATDYPKALRAAESFGFPNIVRYKMKTQAQIDTGRSLNRQAVAQGLPTLLVEIGENGKRKSEHVDEIVRGMKNVMSDLGMLSVHRAEPPQSQRFIDGTKSVPVTHSGIWSPNNSRARLVRKGETLGTIQNYQGEIVETVIAPIDGYTLYGLAGPPVRAGESIVTIGTLVPELD